MKFSKFYINIFSFIIVFLIMFFISGIVLAIFNLSRINYNRSEVKKEEKCSYQNIESKEIKEWSIAIESINLKQKIEEGTDLKIIQNSIGHYIGTDNMENNIALLGYTFNKDKIKGTLLKLEDVKENELIDYKINNFVRQYKVRKNIILNKNEINEYIHTYEEKNILKIFGYIQSNDQKIRYVEAVEIN